MSEYALGDVRLLCSEPTLLASRLHITGLQYGSDLHPFPEQQGQYPDDALVPNPSTIRACTTAEAAHYIRKDTEGSYQKTDVVFYIGETGMAALHAKITRLAPQDIFGKTTSPSGQLTTTLKTDTENGHLKQGLHVDYDETRHHRLGWCVQGQRQLLVVSQSARQILAKNKQNDVCIKSSDIYQVLRDNPALLGTLACLIIPFTVDEGYKGWTGEIVHDGANLIGSSETTIFFGRLT